MKFFFESNTICPLCRFKGKFSSLPDKFRKSIFFKDKEYRIDQYETLNVDDYLCPQCQASDRERLITLYLQMMLKENMRLLHFAPEKSLGTYLMKKLQPEQYATVDLMMPGVKYNDDITDLKSFNDNQFDVFICSHVLEHVPQDSKAISELYRVLKKGGFGIVMVPVPLNLDEIIEDESVTSPEERTEKFGQDDHVRVYSRKGFVDRLKTAGFSVSMKNRYYFGFLNCKKHGITSSSLLYVVKK
jgi:hypothetical protein